MSIAALTKKTKDLQIAVWLTEALVKTEGFEGLTTGLKILTGLLKNYWDHVYPKTDGGDFESRANRLELINEKLSFSVKQIPITDSKSTPGYSWIQWKESQGEMVAEKATGNEKKVTHDDFNLAVYTSAGAYYEALENNLKQCREAFDDFGKIADEKFGTKQAPSFAKIKKSLDDLGQFMSSEKVAELIREEKNKHAPSPEQQTEEDVTIQKDKKGHEEAMYPSSMSMPFESHKTSQFSEAETLEKNVWEDALKKLEKGGIKTALGLIYGASCSTPSVRERYRFRLLMAKLCLKAQRPDLARPIVEELYALINELHLERWESPMWIAEIHDALYQCLTSGKQPSPEDQEKAKELFKKICTMDITRAITY
ncbi:MAG: type VI secretion system ImpA family N-terminal domain-containing protein [Planctomycetia bacterium]|nr:type VI secretion system ImpA family N-terminal domain-containing protein [Planctomycetia bacterium]